MRMRRASEHSIGLPRQGEIISKRSGPGHEAIVFAPPRRTADTRPCHVEAPPPQAGPMLMMIRDLRDSQRLSEGTQTASCWLQPIGARYPLALDAAAFWPDAASS